MAVPAIMGVDVYVSGGVLAGGSEGVDDVKPSEGGGDCGGMYIGMACPCGAAVLPVPITVCSGLPPIAGVKNFVQLVRSPLSRWMALRQTKPGSG